MRTTLTIDEDLAIQIEERRKSDGHSLKEVINALLREGLRADPQAAAPRPYRTRTFALRLRSGVDPMKFNQLADELETEAYRERERTRRS